MVEKEYVDLRALLLQATVCKKPSDDASFAQLLQPLQKDIEGITRAKESNRKDRDWFNHLSTVAEGAVAVGWVTVVSSNWIAKTEELLIIRELKAPKPGPYVKDIKESAEFYANKVLKEWKDKSVIM